MGRQANVRVTVFFLVEKLTLPPPSPLSQNHNSFITYIIQLWGGCNRIIYIVVVCLLCRLIGQYKAIRIKNPLGIVHKAVVVVVEKINLSSSDTCGSVRRRHRASLFAREPSVIRLAQRWQIVFNCLKKLFIDHVRLSNTRIYIYTYTRHLLCVYIFLFIQGEIKRRFPPKIRYQHSRVAIVLITAPNKSQVQCGNTITYRYNILYKIATKNNLVHVVYVTYPQILLTDHVCSNRFCSNR